MYLYKNGQYKGAKINVMMQVWKSETTEQQGYLLKDDISSFYTEQIVEGWL